MSEEKQDGIELGSRIHYVTAENHALDGVRWALCRERARLQ